MNVKTLAVAGALLLSLVGSGCKKGDGLIVVTVDSVSPITVATLHVTATLGTHTGRFDVPQLGALPPQKTFGIQTPPDLSGSMTVQLEAADAAGKQIAAASGTVVISAGERSAVAITFGAPGSTTDMGTGAPDMPGTASDMAGGGADGGGVVPSLKLVAGQPGATGTIDGTGSSARFYSDSALTTDNGGDLFVADNSTIRKVVISTGAVTTIAGTAGVIGSAEGSGASAQFNMPSGVAWDGQGNLYIADSGNNKIRKLSVGSTLTVAGSTTGASGSADGQSVSASFNNPRGLAFDAASGALYIADVGNNTIRKLAVANSAVSTLAGTAGMSGSADGTGAAARFGSISGSMALDGSGNLYAADTSNYTIRKIVVASGAVTTIAGSAGTQGTTDGTGTAARFYAPTGVTYDGNGNLFITEGYEHTIRKLVLATGAVSTVAGVAGIGGAVDGTGNVARFNNLQDVVFETTTGKLYASDAATIRMVDPSSNKVTTLAGSPRITGSADGIGSAASFYTPEGSMALDGNGNVYITDVGNNVIRKVVIATGAVSTFAGSAGVMGNTDGTGAAAQFTYPNGIASDGAGHLFVTDTSNCLIRKIDIATSSVTTFAGKPVAGSADGTGTSASFYGPTGITSDGTNLYVADASNNTIRVIVIASAAVSTLAGMAGTGQGSSDGTGSAARFANPTGIAAYDGALYVTDATNAVLRKVTLTNGEVTTIAGSTGMKGIVDGTLSSARFNNPSGIVADGAGTFYVADSIASTVRKVSLTTGQVTTVVGVANHKGFQPGALPAGLNTPQGLALLPDGQLLILDSLENVLLTTVGLK